MSRTVSPVPRSLPVIPGIRQCPCVRNHAPEPKVLQVHHVWPREYGGPSVPANLVAVCGTCHDTVHAYLRHLMGHGGRQPADWRTYSRHAREMAERGYRRIQANALVD